MFISIFGNDIAEHDIWALKSEKVDFSLYNIYTEIEAHTNYNIRFSGKKYTKNTILKSEKQFSPMLEPMRYHC